VSKSIFVETHNTVRNKGLSNYLILRPYHWHKTEHGLAKTSRQAMLTLAARAAAAKANLL
jgi:hypothetical protein